MATYVVDLDAFREIFFKRDFEQVDFVDYKPNVACGYYPRSYEFLRRRLNAVCSPDTLYQMPASVNAKAKQLQSDPYCALVAGTQTDFC